MTRVPIEFDRMGAVECPPTSCGALRHRGHCNISALAAI
jgi:hypothetical protein